MLKTVYAAFALLTFSGVHAYTCNCGGAKSSSLLILINIQTLITSSPGRNYNNTDIFTAINKGYQIDQTANQLGYVAFPREST